MPNPSVVAGNTNSGSFTTGTQVTVSSTGSVNAGDLMICVLTVGGATAPSALAAPDGTWTTFRTTIANAAGGTIVTAVFYKRATATGSFTGVFGWTTTATSGSWGFFVVNQPGASLVDGNFLSSQNASATNTSPSSTPSAGLVNDTLICGLIGAVVGVDTLTQPAGMTSIINIAGTSTQPFFAIASLALASSGATGTKTWTVPTSQTNLGFTFFIQQGPVFDFTAYDATLPQPSNKNRVAQASGAIAAGDAGIEGSFLRWFNSGWEIQPPPPPHKFVERRGAVLPIEPGNEGRLLGWKNAGWEVQPHQPQHPHPERNAAAILRGDDGTQGTKINFFNFGWSIILHQPQHPRPERTGAIALGDTGTEAKFIPTVATPSVFEAQLPSLPKANPSVAQRGAGASGKSTFAAFSMGPWTEVQSLQPPSYPRARQRYPGTKGSAQFRIFPDLVKMDWDVQSPYLRSVRRLSEPLGDPGKAAAAAPPPAPAAGWQIQSPPIRLAPPKQRAAAAYGRSSFAAFDMRPFTEVQSWQPPRYPPPRQRYAATKGNVQFRIFPNFANMSWEAFPDLPYPRAAHRGAMVPGDPGNQAKFIPPITATILWGLDQTPFAKRNLYRAGTFTERDVETPLIGFFPFGWPVQPIQPGHPSPEKRSAAIARGDDGTQAQRINFFPAGWQVQPHQPQHPRPERAGAIMVGEPGNEGVFSFVAPVFVPDGYNPTAFMPRVRFAKAGALARGEDGTEGIYTVWLPSGWQTENPTQRARRGWLGAIQEDGTIPIAVSTAASFTWGDLDAGVTMRTRRRLRPDETPFSPHALGARFQWGQIEPAMTFPTRRRTLTRAEFHIEGKFVFVPPLPLNIVFNPDNLLRRSFFHPGAAIMQFDGGWFQQRFVSVYFAESIITQASGLTKVTAATAQTVLKGERQGQ